MQKLGAQRYGVTKKIDKVRFLPVLLHAPAAPPSLPARIGGASPYRARPFPQGYVRVFNRFSDPESAIVVAKAGGARPNAVHSSCHSYPHALMSFLVAR